MRIILGSQSNFRSRVIIYWCHPHREAIVRFEISFFLDWPVFASLHRPFSITRHLIWNVLTSLLLQALSANVVLSKSLIEAIGAFALACGPVYAESGILIRATLLPLIERLGDPCQSIRAAAELGTSLLCSACGYEGLNTLISKNIDYIVDDICFRFREIDRHPRSSIFKSACSHSMRQPFAFKWWVLQQFIVWCTNLIGWS